MGDYQFLLHCISEGVKTVITISPFTPICNSPLTATHSTSTPSLSIYISHCLYITTFFPFSFSSSSLLSSLNPHSSRHSHTHPRQHTHHPITDFLINQPCAAPLLSPPRKDRLSFPTSITGDKNSSSSISGRDHTHRGARATTSGGLRQTT